MPSIREYKVALKAGAMAYIAGAHAVTDQVWRLKSDALSGDAREKAFKKLQKSLTAHFKDDGNAEHLADFLNEEGLYPFGEEWSTEALTLMLSLLKPPKMNMDDPYEGSTEFRFKKGFQKNLLAEARKRYAVADEEADVSSSQLDHWLHLLLNGAFQAGALLASRSGDDAATFRAALAAVEEDSEPWARYEQLGRMYDSEMERDENDYDREDSDDDDDDEDVELGFGRRGFGLDDDGGYGDDD